MSNLNLEKTKQKLTIIFTLLVFALAILLEWVFFSIKYFNSKNNDIKVFNTFIWKIYKSDNWLEKIISTLEKRNNYWEWMFHWALNQRMWEWAKLNILIVDRSKNKLVFSKIVNDLDIDVIKNSLTKWEYEILYDNSKYIVEKFEIIDFWERYDLLFIKELKYSFFDYLIDLFWFIFVTFLFSALFYYVWNKFVWKNLEPVKNTLDDMQSFIHNAWHELKTPISIIHSNLQLIKATKTFDKDLVNEWLIEINKLDWLIESLVELSNISSTEYNEELKLSNEIKSIIKDFQSLADDNEVKIKFSKKSEKILLINKQYFYILFSNILKNAIKYNKKWGSVKITLFSNRIEVKDTWIWIKKDDLNKIFDRFFISSFSRNNWWNGIWLSLVKKISDIYRIKIEVESEENSWTKFTIKF